MREYKEYEGWANRPTWDAALIWRNDQDSYNRVRAELEDQPLEERGSVLQRLITGMIDTLITTGRRSLDAPRLHLRDILSYQVAMCNWVRIHNTLIGEPEKGPGEIDQIDLAVIAVLQAQDWQSIIAGIEHMIDKDDALRDWLDNFLETWTNNFPARNSTLTKLAKMFLAEDRRVTHWDEVASSFFDE